MDNFDRLLAKSRRDGEDFRQSMLLIGHLQDVYRAAQRILDSTGADQLRAVGLDPERFLARLRRCVLLAAAVHDLGKANDHFQGMIHRIRNILVNPQGVRHEWVSIVALKALKPWLLPAVENSDLDFSFVEWAIAGHHPAPNHESPPKSPPNGAGVEVTALLGHADLTAILDWVAECFPEINSNSRPAIVNQTYQLGGGWPIFDEIGRSWRVASHCWKKVKDTEDRRFAAVVKDCLIAADIAGSALAKAMPDDRDAWSWITRAFENEPRPADLAKVVDIRLDGKPPREFQEQVAASSKPVTFVKAGCGTGKTVAAYMWAAKNYPDRRLYFCYPTTGTATEGFKDYLFDADGKLGDLNAKLFHSRRDIDFEIILSNGRDEIEQDELAAKLESLEAWSTPIAACTVDTVLGLLQNNRRGMFAWPALAQSAFVFDEIHSYDDRLFGALLRFLTDLSGLPTLLMTASLPKPREEALRRALSARAINLHPIEGPAELEILPRYHPTTSIGDDPLPIIAAEIEAGGKVLWVCNTVARVMTAADAATGLGIEPLIYHSRFKYEDRVERHKAVVSAFTPQHKMAALAICSQVAEMSLDLKGCTLLVSDLASVPALIQRLGRLNRQAKAGDPTRPFCVITPEKSAPYDAEELENAKTWLAKLPASAISQRDLSDCWEQTSDEAPPRVDSAWLDGGPITTVNELRELSPGISVLLRDDVDNTLKKNRNDSDIGRYVIPMDQPRDRRWQSWDDYKGIKIAEKSFIDYDRMRGARWREQSPSILIV